MHKQGSIFAAQSTAITTILAVPLLVTVSSVAQAQTDQDDAIQEIIVTAQKVSQPLQKVSAAVSVVGEDKLDKLGITDLSQISNVTTGVNIEPVRNETLLFVRGIGQTVVGPNADPSVATNLNGVYQPADLAGTSFFDVSRIEVVPGPQGTLYGRNSTGGVVNLIGRLPGNEFATDGRFEVGNYNRRQLVGGVDLPLGQSLAVRFAATMVKHDGYFNNGEDDQDSNALKAAVLWRPTGTTQVKGSIISTHMGGIGIPLDNLPPLVKYAGCVDPRCADFDPTALGYYYKAHTDQGTWEIDQDLGDTLTLTYIGGYSKMSLAEVNTLDAGPPLLPLNVYEDISARSHELRLNGEMGRLKAIAGLYYWNQTGNYRSQNANFFGPVDPGPPASYTFSRDGWQINPAFNKGKGYAAFAQGSYSVLDNLRLIAGVRYSYTQKSINGSSQTYGNTGALSSQLLYTGSNSLDRVDWKAGIEYDLSSDSMAYANASTGFNAGGFSTAPTVPVNGVLEPAQPFKPTFLTAYAAGIKNQFMHGRITINAEGFYDDYKNYQVYTRGVNGLSYVFTADKSTVYGVQLDTHFMPTGNDDLSLGVTWLHAVANTLIVAPNNYSGYVLPYAPKWASNVSYQHGFDLSNAAQLRAAVNFKYTSSRWEIFNHMAGSEQGGNTHTDLSFGYFAAGDKWSIQTFVRNLEDATVKSGCNQSIGTNGFGTACFYEAPRTYGAAVSFKY